MRAVMEYGTGFALEPPGFRVAMKTGTASLPRLGYHVNYLGFAPVERPSVAFCIRVTGQRSSPRIRADARAVTARLLAALAERRDWLDRGARSQRALVHASARGETP
jgi:cell division protein FtsI/penicillin-binding protein 2